MFVYGMYAFVYLCVHVVYLVYKTVYNSYPCTLPCIHPCSYSLAKFNEGMKNTNNIPRTFDQVKL